MLGDTRLPYAAANQVANLLADNGIGPGDPRRPVLCQRALFPDRLLRHPQSRRGQRDARRPAMVTAMSRPIAALDGRLAAAVSACRQ